MRCIAHIWNSFDCDGNRFLLCLSPLDSVVGGAPVEAFPDEKSLSQRLVDMGVRTDFIQKNLPSLWNFKEVTWTDIEISQLAFESFGRGTSQGIECSDPSREKLGQVSDCLHTRPGCRGISLVR
jgi:hypothetical protein